MVEDGADLYIGDVWLRWKGVFWDVLVCSVMVAFGVNVVQRVQHVVQHHRKHLWQVLYHRTAILLDIAILALQAFSKSVGINCVATLWLACYRSMWDTYT